MTIKDITEEVIEVLVSLARGVIGHNLGSVVLRELDITNKNDGKEIVFKFAGSLEINLGKHGAYATLRQVGRDLAKKIMAENSEDKWNFLFLNALNEFGFANEVVKNDTSAFICNCVFYDVLQLEGLEPTEHPVCWIGWGFIEGFMKEFENIQRIKWTYRDIENRRCKFDFIYNDEDLNFN